MEGLMGVDLPFPTEMENKFLALRFFLIPNHPKPWHSQIIEKGLLSSKSLKIDHAWERRSRCPPPGSDEANPYSAKAIGGKAEAHAKAGDELSEEDLEVVAGGAAKRVGSLWRPNPLPRPTRPRIKPRPMRPIWIVRINHFWTAQLSMR